MGIDSVFEGVALVQRIIIPFVITVATTLFLWGLLRYAFSSQHEGEQEHGKKVMLYGVVTIFIATVIWALLSWLLGLAGQGGPPDLEEDGESTSEVEVGGSVDLQITPYE